jgi:flagellar protein FlaG
MSAETFTTAMFLITAVIAAGVLINAVFPVVYTMAGTFQSATHESDQRLRTDFKIVTTFANSTTANVWMKNIGSQRIPNSDILRSDVFCGPSENYGRVSDWTFTIFDLNGNNDWDPGETLQISVRPPSMPAKGNLVYFQFILPDGIWRSIEFNVS